VDWHSLGESSHIPPISELFEMFLMTLSLLLQMVSLLLSLL
jgi:hypothetical protein